MQSSNLADPVLHPMSHVFTYDGKHLGRATRRALPPHALQQSTPEPQAPVAGAKSHHELRVKKGPPFGGPLSGWHADGQRLG